MKIMNKNPCGDRLIIVGGAPRSGTTLLQNMLDSHPDITGGPEFLHLPDIVSLQQKLHASIAKEWIDFFCSKEDVNRYTGELIENFLLPLLDRQGGKFLSEKTPNNILIFSELLDILPRARFIQVIRDPRAIVSSMLEVGAKARKKGENPPYFTKDMDSASSYVNKCFDAGFSAEKKNGRHVLTVRYEDLVVNPEQESKKVCEFLGLLWDQDMSNPAGVKHLGEKAITVNSNEIWYDKNMYNSNPHTQSVNKWREALTAAQQLSIQKTFGNNVDLQNLGYSINSDHLSSGKRVVGVVYNSFIQIQKKLMHNKISRSVFKKVASTMN